MESSQIESRIEEHLPGASLEVSGADCDFSVTIISPDFEGLNAMKRQQMILSLFSDVIKTGELHALSIKAFTLDEWNNKSSGLVQLSI